MARVFPEDSPWLDKDNVGESLEKIEKYLRYMQERIEHMNYAQGKVDERMAEELNLVVTREGSTVEINTNNIVSSVEIEGLESQIEQNAGNITSIVQAVGDGGTVTAASIVQAVNNSASTIKISADHITLDGDVVMKSNLIDGSTQISGSNITTGTINAARIDTNSLYINGSNVTSAVASANALASTATLLMAQVNSATASATSSGNGLQIGGSNGAKLYANQNLLNIYFPDTLSSIQFTPYGQTLTIYGSSTTFKSFITVSDGNATYGIGIQNGTPTNGFVRVQD